MKVTFLPQQKTVEARRGKTILTLAKEEGVRIMYDCDGNCTCGTCFVYVEKGAENLSAASEKEQAHLERQSLPQNARLSCQTHLLGDVVVRIATVRT